MDPQKLASLDPKLRDAYQRVMGTTIPEPQATPVQTQTPPAAPIPDPAPTPQSQPEPIPTPPIPETPVQTPVSEPQSIPTPEPTMPEPQPAIPPQPQSPNFVQMNSEVAATPVSANFATPAPMPQTQTMSVKKKRGLIIPILAGLVFLIFLVIYFLFWAKIFNFKLPFLS